MAARLEAPHAIRRTPMKEENEVEKTIHDQPIAPKKRSMVETLKTKAKALAAHNCAGCAKREAAVHGAASTVATVAGTTAVGLGVGLTLGVGALAAAAVAEVAIPAVLTFKALGLTCSALGFCKGAKDLKKRKA